MSFITGVSLSRCVRGGMTLHWACSMIAESMQTAHLVTAARDSDRSTATAAARRGRRLCQAAAAVLRLPAPGSLRPVTTSRVAEVGAKLPTLPSSSWCHLGWCTGCLRWQARERPAVKVDSSLSHDSRPGTRPRPVTATAPQRRAGRASGRAKASEPKPGVVVTVLIRMDQHCHKFHVLNDYFLI